MPRKKKKNDGAKSLLDDDDDSGSFDGKVQVNEGYAKQFEVWKLLSGNIIP